MFTVAKFRSSEANTQNQPRGEKTNMMAGHAQANRKKDTNLLLRNYGKWPDRERSQSVILSPTHPVRQGGLVKLALSQSTIQHRVGAETVMNFSQFSYDNIIYKGKNSNELKKKKNRSILTNDLKLLDPTVHYFILGFETWNLCLKKTNDGWIDGQTDGFLCDVLYAQAYIWLIVQILDSDAILLCFISLINPPSSCYPALIVIMIYTYDQSEGKKMEPCKEPCNWQRPVWGATLGSTSCAYWADNSWCI